MNAATVPQPVPACNAPSALDHADAMLAHLRGVGPGFGHELARAMLVSATFYLVDVFGREHALAVASALVPPVLGVSQAPEAVPGEVAAPAEILSATLH